MASRLLVSRPGPDWGPEAVRQWERFFELAGCLGVEPVELASNPQAPGLVFAAHAALIAGGLAIVSSFRHAERRREQPLLRAGLAKAGFATTFLRQTYFEGGGDALFDRVRPVLYAGYGWRTERAAVMQLQEIIGCRVLPLLLVDERLPHLDQVLCPLGSGHVLVHLAALSPYAQQLVRRAVDPGALIEVSLDDALGGACGALEIGDALLLDGCSRRLRERLNGIGYRVFCTDLGAFAAGGGARALALRLDDGPAAGMAAATA